MIDLYHVTEGTRTEILSMQQTAKLNYLTTAWAYWRDNRVKKNLATIRDNACSLIIDSGFLGAAKKGHLNWKDNQPYVVDVAIKAHANVVVSLNIPMEPFVLKQVNLTRKQALQTTLRNAEALLAQNTNGVTKMFVVQGWLLKDYEYCFRELEKMGCISPEYWIGIGSVCMRKPCRKGRENYPSYWLYDVARLVGNMVPQNIHLHCFGIAKPDWVKKLGTLGVNSCDSASAIMAVAFRRRYNDYGKQDYCVTNSTVETRAELLTHNKCKLNKLIKENDRQMTFLD